MKKFFIPLFLFLPIVAFTQSGFIRMYGGPQSDDGLYVLEDSQHNFVICGDTGKVSTQPNSGDVFLLSIDSVGNIIWEKSIGDTANELARCVKETPDGGFILFGNHNDYLTEKDAYLIKTSSNGDSLWSKLFIGGNESRYGVSVIALPDGEYILGSVNDDIQSYNPYQLVRTDSNGNINWSNYIDLIPSTYFGGSGCSLEMTNDRGFVFCGTNEINFQSQDIETLVKTDISGTIQWSHSFSGMNNCDGISVLQCFDGGYILAGYTDSYGAGGDDMYIIKTDSNGDSLWAKTFGGSGFEVAKAVQQTSDSGFVIFGNSINDAIILRLNASGDSLWEKSFGDSGEVSVNQGIVCHDGGFALVGSTTSGSITNSSDVLFIKTDSLGNILTSVNEVGKTQSLSCYPDPFSENITLNLLSDEKSEIKIFDSIGRCIYHFSGYTNGHLNVETSNFNRGFYIVKSINRNGEYYCKIVKL